MKTRLLATLLSLAITMIPLYHFSVAPEGGVASLWFFAGITWVFLIGAFIALASHFEKKKKMRQKSEAVMKVLAQRTPRHG